MGSQATNQDIIEAFKKAAAVLQIIDKSPFRVRAYQNAIDTIENLDEEVSQLSLKVDLDNLPGIGAELSSKIKDLVNIGKSKALEELYAKVPSGMFPLLNIPGLGAKRAYQIATEFNLTDPDDSVEKVKHLAQTKKLQKLPGFGEKLEAQILENIDRHKPKSNRMLLSQADTIAQKVIGYLKTIPEVINIEALGSVRRRRETAGDVDLGLSTHHPEAVINHLRNWSGLQTINVSGEQVLRLVLPGNIQVDVKMIPPKQWGSMLQHFTGSKLHNVALREKSLKMGKSLSEHGIKYQGKLHQYDSEYDFYQALGMDYIPPELRENTGEIQAASNNRLPALVKHNQIIGDFHTHTNYNWISSHDYGSPIPQILNQSSKLGYDWISLGDHNLAQSNYTVSEMVEELHKRSRWIEHQYNSWKQTVKTNIDYLVTLEIDILPDGQLAVPLTDNSPLDYAIVSIHSAFTYPSNHQTDRILKALSYPKVKILGHPTGRLVDKRPPINADWEKVFKYCGTHQIALEINASPHRLDLPDSLVKEALKHKVKFALGTDAHDADHLPFIHYAVDVARRGWVPASAILNTYSYQKLNKWLKS